METSTVDNTLARAKLKEKQAKRRAFLFTFIPLLAGLFFIYYTSSKVSESQAQLTVIKKEVDSVKILRDSFMLEYLSAKGFNKSKKYQLLDESINANKLLNTLLEQGKINPNLEIKYFRKTLDEQKVWLSIKELGFNRITDIQTKDSILNKIETNAVVIGRNVSLYDLKIILLTLIRAGFRIQHVGESMNKKNADDLIQILGITPANGSPDKSVPLSVNEIKNATSKEQLFR